MVKGKEKAKNAYFKNPTLANYLAYVNYKDEPSAKVEKPAKHEKIENAEKPEEIVEEIKPELEQANVVIDY